MHSDTVTIYCSNHLCQAPNPESHRFCQQCRTLLPKRYLWVVGKGIESRRSGELLGGRYSVKQSNIVLDTMPGRLPHAPAEISSDIEPYLRLAAYQLHVPQVYGVVEASPKRGGEVLLLEQAPLYADGVVNDAATPIDGQLMPELTAVWAQSNALRQLNWLWQLAHLWEPLASEGVATTLLNPELLRVEGALVRLRSLQTDGRTPARLTDLGKLWQQWQPAAQAEIAAFLGELCQWMQSGQVRNAEQLIMLLDQGLAACGKTQARHLHIATLTDQGPSRQRNEDACYPPSGTVWTGIEPGQTQPLVVVCDGIGGHEGGNVASNLAIDTMQQQLQSLPFQNGLIEPTVLMLHLEQATLTANDLISQRNDDEQRQERQRMGTTLVMALAYAHEVYLAHVGDSRIYRVSRLGCHQVTLDDDLASREVRLGYALYREALQQPGSGSLVQALGMGASTMLHPTVQRFVLDEDCVFLLCSDGLSDHDRVDEFWQSELLPLLDGTIDVATATQRLLTIANTKNGHDNVTIGLLHCQVAPPSSPTNAIPLPVMVDAPTVGSHPTVPIPQPDGSSTTRTTQKTQIVPTQKPSTHPLVTLLALLVLLGLGGVFAYALFPGLRIGLASLTGFPPFGVQSSPQPETSVEVPLSPVPESPPPQIEALSVGSLLLIERSAIESSPTPLPSLELWSQPEQTIGTAKGRVRLGTLPAGSVLQLSSRQSIPDRGYWLKLKVCLVPATVPPTPNAPPASPPKPTLQSGESGWIEQDAIAPFVTQNLGLKASQLGACAPSLPITPSPSASPSPTPKTKPVG
ncbi:MAG: protein phosphatase 2C domain-containing protein [Lyngbya sp. HA4199-MV5]|jgi:serine/threonine protein phosphatase PrpC|nr:protein phosphatase 2C domain-containing protein [Lyngbya sp. HA4199-MV5]